MLVLAKAMLSLMIGFILSIIAGLVIIPILKKKKAKQNVSVFLKKSHSKKDGTPTMGGFIFIIPTIITILILLITNRIEFTENLFLILFVFVTYALLGFIDDYLIIKRKNNIGLTEIQKLFGQLIICHHATSQASQNTCMLHLLSRNIGLQSQIPSLKSVQMFQILQYQAFQHNV